MPRESKQARRQRALAIIERLGVELPQAQIELHYTTALELLVAVMLSAQCTDRRVNLVTPALFARFRTAADYAGADVAELEGLVRTCGLYRSKAKNLIATGRALVQLHGGQVPTSREALQGLPGVGRKTAGVVAIHLGEGGAFPVDTHILRLSRRMGLSTHADPDKVERHLQEVLPPGWWTTGHQLLIWHGRRTCLARAPRCGSCAVAGLCPKVGVAPARPARARRGRSSPAAE